MIGAWRDLIVYFKREPWVAGMLVVLAAAAIWAYAFAGGVKVGTIAPADEIPAASTGVLAEDHSEAGRLKTTHRIEAWGERLVSNPAHRTLIATTTLLVLLILMLGVAWDMLLVSRIRRGEVPAERFGSPRTPWGLGDAFKALILLFFLDLVFSAALSIGCALAGIQASNLVMMGASFVRSLVVVFYLGALVRKRYAGTWSDLGLCGSRWIRQVVWGLGGYLAMIPVYALVLAALIGFLQLFNLESPVQTPVQVLFTEGNAGSVIAFAVFMGILGPWFEEILFRGFVYPAFKNRMGIGWGILSSSILFAAMHGHGIAFVPILVLALALHVLYERTGSVIPGAVLHMTHNSAMLLITLGIKQAAS